MAENLQADMPESHKITKIVAMGAQLLVLSLPSLWLMVRVPMLWRGTDAYVQTVYPPGAGTILRHGALYCTFSRVPLWVGYLISGSGPVVSLGHFIKHSQLTETGVFALVLLQHAAVWCAALYLIRSIGSILPTRLFLAMFFATHPLFYTFAHCIGSETLSMILALFLAGNGARLFLRYPNIRLRDWIIFTALLCCCILTRHINSVLTAILPMTIGLLMIERCLHAFASHRNAIPAVNFNLSKATHIWLTSIVIGLISLLLATSFTHLLCWRAHTQWRSTFGYTFLWRLNFLDTMPTTFRDGFLDSVASKCKLPETRRLLATLKDRFAKNKPWDPRSFLKEEGARLFSSAGKLQEEKFDRSLNEMANAFLWPPGVALRSAALSDFHHATKLGEGDVVQYLFTSTDSLFDHRERTPQLSRLKVFASRDKLMKVRKLSYFQWWNALSFRTGVLVGCVAFLLALVVEHKCGGANVPLILFSGCLCAVGVIMVLLNCFCVQLLPRFILPMMEFLLISMMILLGLIFRGCKIPEHEPRWK
jgi:hypothetical protein